MGSYIFKIADSPWDFEQVHRLNYRAFVEEIPQHSPNPERKLVDRFNDQNTYLIACSGQKLLGMVTFRDQRPFSLDEKLADLDSYLPPARKTVEIRLFTIEPEYRTGAVLRGIFEKGFSYCIGQGYTMAIISGTVRQLKLYKRIGFVPFGPLVGKNEAWYQPMYVTLEDFLDRIPWLLRLASKYSAG